LNEIENKFDFKVSALGGRIESINNELKSTKNINVNEGFKVPPVPKTFSSILNDSVSSNKDSSVVNSGSTSKSKLTQSNIVFNSNSFSYNSQSPRVQRTSVTSSDGFKTVEPKKKKRFNGKQITGESTFIGEDSNMYGVDSRAYFYTSHWKNSIDVSNVTAFVSVFAKTKVYEVKEIESKYEYSYYKAFKITVSTSDIEAMFTPKNWPPGIRIRRWINYRRKESSTKDNLDCNSEGKLVANSDLNTNTKLNSNVNSSSVVSSDNSVNLVNNHNRNKND
jgi:hypothetical protein